MMSGVESGEITSVPGRIRLALAGDYPVIGDQFKGGVQSATAYLAKGLARIPNLDVHVLTMKPDGWKGPDTIQQNGLTLHLMRPYPRFERVRIYRNYQAIFNQALAGFHPDLIHAQNAGMYAYVSLRSGYPAVITAHGIRREDGKYYGSWGRRLRNIFDSLVIERYVISHTNHLIAISKYVTAYYANLLRQDVHIYHIPNAIDERFFESNRIPEKPVILFAGAVIPRKRVLDIIQAFAQVLKEMPTARLRIAGECGSEPAYVATLHAWINQANLEKKVDWLGALPEIDILQEFGNCSLVVLASSQETTPMVLAQAMAASKPVVATSVGGVAEMLGENSDRGLLINVGDIDGLAKASLRILQNPSLAVRMGQAGKFFARENYHTDIIAQRTFEIYANMLRKRMEI